jgi:small conductance mechanosensitive channel
MDASFDFATIFSTYVIPWSINIAFAAAIFIGGRIISKLLVKLLVKVLHKANLDEILVTFIGSLVRNGLLLIIIIAALEELGVDTTSLIAVLGAAGLAVGLALQNSLQNFAAGVMLILFRPFKKGDFIEAGGTAGVVETITIFSTVMRTGDNREVIVPNGAIYSGTITNYSARDTRRLDMEFGIGYDDDIRKAKQLIQEILSGEERILAEPETLIAVGELADSSVNIVVRPWVKSDDYWPVRFDLTERVKIAFDDAGISIPFPQMDVHMQKAA